MDQNSNSPTLPEKSTSEASASPQEINYSYSRLIDHNICPARNYFKTLAREGKIQEDVCLPAIFGSGIHKGIEVRLKEGKNPFKVAEEYVHKEIDQTEYKDFTSDEYKDKSEILDRCITNFERDFYPDLSKELTDPEHQVEVGMEMPFRKGKLVGHIDVVLPGIFADWKSGALPKDKDVQWNTQHAFYYKLGEANPEIGAPTLFEYVYLQGKNIAYRAPKKKTPTNRPVLNKEDPEYKYSWPVRLNAEEVERTFRNTINPLAASYEKTLTEGIIWKNRSQWNCSNCRYRTVCADYDLPEIINE